MQHFLATMFFFPFLSNMLREILAYRFSKSLPVEEEVVYIKAKIQFILPQQRVPQQRS